MTTLTLKAVFIFTSILKQRMVEPWPNKHRLQAVIVSGDIGNISEREEYMAAENFFSRLCRQFDVGASQMVIVPGNHDLNWQLANKGYRLIDKEDHDGPLKEGEFIRVSEEVIRLCDQDAYPQRFQHFSQFYENITGQSYPLAPETQATFHHLPDLNLLVVGFNSNWEVDHHFKDRVSINPDAVTIAIDHIRDNPKLKNCLKMAVWHHPLNGEKEDRIKNHDFMQRLSVAGFQICLHGHIHKADTDLYRYDKASDQRQIHLVGAGTFGAPAQEWTAGYPLQYNLLRLSGNILRVETRRRIEINGAWEPDHLWRQGKGMPKLAYYDIPLSIEPLSKATSPPKTTKPEPSPSKSVPGTTESFETEIKKYCSKAEAFHENLPVAGFATHLKVLIDLEEIYIPLRAMLDLRGIDDCEHYSDAVDAEKRLKECGADLEIGLIDAFSEAAKRKKKGLVILGDPGSGKTTYLKRMLLWCLRKGPQTMGLPEGMIPVFLPLRELKDINSGLDHFIQDQLTSRHLKTAAGFGESLLSRGNLLFLLDGLDEVANLEQREAVSSWIEEAYNDYPDCRFVVTCRFAGYHPSVRLDEHFLEMHVRPLPEKDAERFVRKWYAIVEKGLARDHDQAESIALEKAEHLIDRLRQPDFRARRVFEMTRNPLLLTNICLVHRHRGDLPQRRARLYDECIDVLLEHWRGAKKLALGVKALQGRQVLQPAALWMHREDSRTRATADELAPQIQPVLKEIRWNGGSAKDFLDIIRDESGLLTGWDQDHYGFMHLGFQEYLAAREIRSRFQQEMNENGKSELLKELAGHFGDSWWQEVALLLLAIEDPPLFVPFMRAVLTNPAFRKQMDMIEMCLDDAIKPTSKPFREMLEKPYGKNLETWKCQLTALRMVERLDEELSENTLKRFNDHPYQELREWIRDRVKETEQDLIHPGPSGYELVLIKGGSFLMGSSEHESEQPVHKITLPDFFMGRFPVTNEEYGRFLAATGRNEPEYWADRKFNQPRQPVVGVSWHDAKKYAQWAGLHLPSEAQWEYACRAETVTRYSWGDEPDCLKANYGNSSFAKECKGINPGKPSTVGNYPPNPWGLYDMHGNVWEWCEDHYHDNYKGAPEDGSAWVDKEKGARWVLRGGAWHNSALYCRTAFRIWFAPGYRFDGFGFRLVRLPGQQSESSR